MHSPRVLDKRWLLPTPVPTFASSPDPAPTLSALPSGSEDGQEGCRWGECSHSGSPESPQTAANSPPPRGTLPVVCRHISENTGTNVKTGPWLTTEQQRKAGCSLASKEPSTTLSPQAFLQLQACPPYVPHPPLFSVVTTPVPTGLLLSDAPAQVDGVKANAVGGRSGLQCWYHRPQQHVPLPMHIPESRRNENPDAVPSGGKQRACKQRAGLDLGISPTPQFPRHSCDHPSAQSMSQVRQCGGSGGSGGGERGGLGEVSSRPPENKLLVAPAAEPRKLKPTCYFSSTLFLSNNYYYALTICPRKAQALEVSTIFISSLLIKKLKLKM